MEKSPFLMLAAAVAALLFIAMLFFALSPQASGELKEFSFKDADSGKAISGLRIEFSLAGGKTVLKISGSDGTVSLNAPSGRVRLKVLSAAFKKVDFEFAQALAKNEVLLGKKAASNGKMTFYLTAADGTPVKNAAIMLGCSNALAEIPESSFSTDSGSFSAEAPENCGIFSAIVIADGFRQANFALSKSGPLVLEGPIAPSGKIAAFAFNDGNSIASGALLHFYLLDSKGLKIQRQDSNSGRAVFEGVVQGSYSVAVSDSAGKFLPAQSRLSLNAGEEKAVKIMLSSRKSFALNVKAYDSSSGALLSSAEVLVSESGSNSFAAAGMTVNGIAQFNLFEGKRYKLLASKAGYKSFLREFQALGGGLEISAMLEKCSAALGNCGKIEVTVVDSEENPVENASVFLSAKGSSESASLYSEVSGFDGKAVFTGFAAGEYFATAVKAEKSAKSEDFEVAEGSEKSIGLKLGLAQKKVTVTVIDPEGRPVDGAAVELVPVFGDCNACSSTTGPQGNAVIEIRADRKFFVKAGKEGFAGFKGAVIDAESNDEAFAFLRLPFDSGYPEIEVAKILNADFSKAFEIMAGKEYKAVVLAQTPRGKGFGILGAHLRASNESLRIGEILSTAGSVYGSSSFTPFLGEEADMLPQGLAEWKKWQSIVFESPEENTVFESIVSFKASEGFEEFDDSAILYRAWLEGDGKFYRIPLDANLGEERETAQIQGLYANVRGFALASGTPLNCSAVCFFAEKIFDSDGMEFERPFELPKNSGKLSFSFKLLNSFGKAFSREDNIIVGVSSAVDESSQAGDLKFSSARIYDSSSVISEDMSVNAGFFEMPVDDWPANEALTGVSEFEVLGNEGASQIEVMVFSGEELLLSRTVLLEIVPLQSLRIEFTGDSPLPFSQNDLNFTVSDSDGNPAGNALVRLYRQGIGPEALVSEAFSESSGNAFFSGQAAGFGTVFRAVASKQGYRKAEAAVQASSQIVELSPSELSFSLQQGSPGQSIDAELLNRLPIGLKVSGAFFQGLAAKYLDSERMNSALAAGLSGKALEPEIPLAFTASAFAKPSLDWISFSSSHEFTVVAENSALSKRFVLSFPAKISMLPSGSHGTDENEQSCLAVSQSKFSGETLSGKAVFRFRIDSNCAGIGQSAVLKSLEARISGASAKSLGASDFYTINDSNEYSLILSEEWNSAIGKEISGNGINAMLEFTPYAGNLGKRAEFNLELKAFFSDGSSEALAVPEEPLAFDILIQDLARCVKFNPSMEEGIKIGSAGGPEGPEFSIDTSSCGSEAVKVRLCNGDAQCSGNTPEGGIDVSPKSLAAGKNEISVKRQSMAGYYGIKAEATADGNSWNLIGLYPVLVEPGGSDYYLSMEKYSFNFADNNTDSARVYSHKVEENIEVEASICDWEKAAKGYLFSQSKGSSQVIGGGGGLAIAVVVGIFCPVCGLITAVVLIGGGAVLGSLGGGGGNVCDEKTLTETLPDYIVNLSGRNPDTLEKALAQDALSASLALNSGTVSAEWKIDNPIFARNGSGENESLSSEEVGVSMSLSSGGLKKFDVLELKFTDHVHGDAMHSGEAAVFCHNGNFGPYNVGPSGEQGECSDAVDVERSEKFHIYFRDSEDWMHFEVPDGNKACNPMKCGYTGKKALPEISLDWDWSKRGTESCNLRSAEGSYCDAAQFTMALFSKMNAFENFLQENQYFAGVCPSEEGESNSYSDSNASSFQVGDGNIGYSRISYVLSGNSLGIDFSVKNNSAADALANYSVSVLNGISEGLTGAAACTGTLELPAGGTVEESCSKILQPNKLYYVVFDINSEAEPEIVQGTGDFYIILLVGNSQPQQPGTGGEGCESPRTTRYNLGEPGIAPFIREAAKTRPVLLEGKPYTSQNIEALVSKVGAMLRFDAWLVKDNFSDDFRKDFIEYYRNRALLQAPSFFKEDAGLWQYLDSKDMMKIRMRDYDSFSLPDAGRYNVEVGIDYGEGWRLFDSKGTPRAKVNVMLSHISRPSRPSPLHYLPFDGELGLKKNAVNRIGYGSALLNSGSWLYGNGQGGRLWPKDSNSIPAAGVYYYSIAGFKNINSTASERGRLMMIFHKNGVFEARFSPSLATPVIMDVSKTGADGNEFKVFYGAIVGDRIDSSFGNLAFWNFPEGHSCKDFEGFLLSEKFSGKADRKAIIEDGINDWENAFKAEWQSAQASGTVPLPAMFYSSPEEDISLFIFDESLGNAMLHSGKESGRSIVLNGFPEASKNFKGSGGVSAISSLQDAFEAVEKGDAFVDYSKDEISFWWNEDRMMALNNSANETLFQDCIQ